MKLKTVHRENIFIPEFNGNKDLSESDQVKIQIKKWPTVTEIKAYKSFKIDSSGSVEMSYKDNIMIPSCVGRITGLNDGKSDIKNGSDLAMSTNPILGDLITELREHILSDGEEIEPGE